MIDIDEIKHYLRVDEDYDDELIESYLKASEEYLKNAGVKENKKEKALYKLCIKMICKKLYNCEDYVTDKGIKAIISQLVYCG